MIASDANNSGTITTLDLIQFRKLILRLDENLKENTSWRFIPVSYEFPDPQNPWKEKWPEVMNLNNLLLSYNAADFVGIKIGDVNASVKSNSNQPGYRSDFSKTVFLEYKDQAFEQNEVFETDFHLESSVVPQGLQFTFEYESDYLEIEKISSPQFKDFNFAEFKEEGVFTGIWYNFQEIPIAKNPIFIKIQFRAKRKGSLEKSIQLTSSKTHKEAFSGNGELLGLSLKTSKEIDKNELYPNWPNPFQNWTNVEFYSETNEKAIIQIHNIGGKLVQKFEVKAHQRMNKVQVEGLESGVYILSLTIGNWTGNIRMLATK